MLSQLVVVKSATPLAMSSQLARHPANTTGKPIMFTLVEPCTMTAPICDPWGVTGDPTVATG